MLGKTFIFGGFIELTFFGKYQTTLMADRDNQVGYSGRKYFIDNLKTSNKNNFSFTVTIKI